MTGIQNKIDIADITLREAGTNPTGRLGFKEKIEIARRLDQVRVDVIETAPILNGKTDILFLHTICPLLKQSVLSCPVSLSEESIAATWNAIKSAAHPRLHVRIPVSAVQMEYQCGLKPPKALELIAQQTAQCLALCPDVEVSLVDATRADLDFLRRAIDQVIKAGAKTLTLCDTAGVMLPHEFSLFLQEVITDDHFPNINWSVECNNNLNLANSCEIVSLTHGIVQIKTTTIGSAAPDLVSIGRIVHAKGASLCVQSGLNMAVLGESFKQISQMAERCANGASPFDHVEVSDYADNGKLTKSDDLESVGAAIDHMGYDLSEEDVKNVYEEFQRIVSKKNEVGLKELDAIIASTALQVPPTYKLNSFLINTGNKITSTAHIILEKDGAMVQGLSMGDGPVDAAFLAIENIIGYHYELDDFQIQSVTEGAEAVADSVVKLRSKGKLYSGRGISTNIVGASIRAYINALNKICYEESAE